MNKIEIDKSFLEDEYIRKKKTIHQIAKNLSIGYGTVRRRLIEYKIKRRTQKEAQKLVNRNGENHPHWKGDSVSYKGLHLWLDREKPKPKYCEICGINQPKHCANKDHKYNRNLDDYMWLCVSCHRKYDIKNRGKWKN